jgi:hypothetical protein
MAVLSQVRQDAGLFALLLEALECPLEVLIVVDDDFRQTDSPPLMAFARLISEVSR